MTPHPFHPGAEPFPPPRPSVPAMSLDEARALLVRQHGVAIGNDDPILMLVTLHQGFLGDHAALLATHTEALRAVLAEAEGQYAAGVGKMLDGMKDKTVQAAIDTAFGIVSHQARETEALRLSLHRFRRSLIVITSLAWLAALVVVGLLTVILK